MKLAVIFTIVFLFVSCNSDESFSVTKLINGNTIQLSNGVIVSLLNVQNDSQNLNILKHYLTGPITLYSTDHEEITEFTTGNISAIVYNSEGDEINKLLIGVKEITHSPPSTTNNNINSNKTIVKMTIADGVINIPVKINGEDLFFIFDTGAGLISISSSEADKLYSTGKLKNSDFIGKGNFTDANGNISQGSIINLTDVQIGNIILKNVEACVNANQNAPLLFGESALQKFGKVSIDYVRNEITLE